MLSRGGGLERGQLIVISGPSGAGKTSICKGLLVQLSSTVWSVSATTRPMRQGEESGRSYEFISREEFARRRNRGEFLECAEYVGEWYGTPRSPAEAAIRSGKNMLLEIEVQGGIQVASQLPDAVMIFVLPPDMESLRARLEGRNTEAKEQLARRLAEADGEIATARDSGYYRHFVVNDLLQESIDQIKCIIRKASEYD